MISVIVPAHNAEAVLPWCLQALLRQTVSRPDYEIIVVDDGSTDGTAAVARAHGVRLVQTPHRGPAAARNRGAEVARGDLLLFTDADCAPAPDWIAHLAAALADSTVAAAKGAYATRQTGRLPQFVQAEFEERYRLLAQADAIDFVDTYSAAYRRSVFAEVGGFDPAFPVPSAEDADLSFRLARQGYRLVFVPGAIVFHRHAERLRDYLGRKLRYGIWRTRTYRQHPDKVLRDSYTPNTVRWQVVLVALALALLPVALLWAPARLLLAGVTATFLLTTLGLSRQAARRDRRLALLAPGLIALRAGAQTVGLGLGTLLLVRAALGPASGRFLRRFERSVALLHRGE